MDNLGSKGSHFRTKRYRKLPPFPYILISNLINKNAANSDGSLSLQIPELTQYDTEISRSLQMTLADLEIVLSRKRCDP